MYRTITLIVFAAFLVACSATPVVTSSPGDAEFLAGIPMRIKREHVVRLYEYDPTDDQYKLTSQGHQMLADQTRLYAVDIDSKAFSSPTLHIAQNADNTIKLIQTATTQNATTAIDAVSGTATSISSASATALSTQNTITAACQVSNTAVISADQALAAARAAYDGLPQTASQELKNAYLGVIESAKRAADYARASSACK